MHHARWFCVYVLKKPFFIILMYPILIILMYRWVLGHKLCALLACLLAFVVIFGLVLVVVA